MQILWRKGTQCKRQNSNFYPLLTTTVVPGNYDIFTKPIEETFISCAGMECVAHLVTREQCQFIFHSAKQILKYYSCVPKHMHYPFSYLKKTCNFLSYSPYSDWLLLKTINSQHEILASLWNPLAAHQIFPVIS